MEPLLFLGFNCSNDVAQNRLNLLYSAAIVSYTVFKLNIKNEILNWFFFIKLNHESCNYVFRFMITMSFSILFVATDHNSI